MRVNFKFLRFFILYGILLLCFQGMAQKTANQLVYGVYKKMSLTKDYSADVNIRVDLPFIRMLPVDAQVYYKQPDKFRVKSTGIAILPKQGFSDFSKTISDTNSYSAFIAGNEKIGTVTTTIVNIIPNADTSDLVLGKFWIDPLRNIVLRSQLTTKSNGTILINYFYGAQVAYGLPDSLQFTVDVKKFKIPKGVSADINNTKTPEATAGKDPKKGNIYITIKNYKVNKGIDDSVFKN